MIGRLSCYAPNTPEWLEARAERLGASPGEISAALTIPGGYGSPADVWGRKVLRRRGQGPARELAIFGHAVEAVIPELFADRFPTMDPGGWWYDRETCCAASLDWQIPSGEPVESKTAWWGLGADSYGEEECSPAVTLQALMQARLVGAAGAYVVVVVIGGYGPKLHTYELELSPARERVIDGIRERAQRWWRAHVEPQIPPPDAEPALWAASARLREEVEPVAATREDTLLAAELVEISERLSPLVERKKELRRLLAAGAKGAPLQGEGWAYRPDRRGSYRLSGYPLVGGE